MQAVRVLGASLEGTGAMAVTVEARFEEKSSGTTEVVLTGLPDPVLRESRGKLLGILREGQLRMGPGRLFLNLVPAARRKSGEMLDLPLVLAAAAAGGNLSSRAFEGTMFVGEVGIDGALHAVPGGLAAAVVARDAGIGQLIAPPETALEAAALLDIDARAARDLRAVLAHLTEAVPVLERQAPPPDEGGPACSAGRLDEVRGQATGKLALQVAATGGHGLLLVGPPGAGKSMLARRLVDLLPEPTLDERVEVTSVLSAAGRWPRGLARRRPFRAPHHTTSFAGLVGGGVPVSPGEITLAHRGVLFLDELPEFSREALEALRQPLEEGAVHLSRATRRVTLPARFQLVAAMNPCPCGYRGHPRLVCSCPPGHVRRYRQRISGPLLDRIDLRVALRPAPLEDLVGRPSAPEATELRGEALARAAADARARQRSRGQTCSNAELHADALDRWSPIDDGSRSFFHRAAEKNELSARAVQSLRRVARTLADLEESELPDARHLAQAVSLRAPV